MVVLGVDIGGTKIAAAAVLANGSVRGKFIVDTPEKHTASSLIDAIILACSTVLKKHKCTAIGVSLPGFATPQGSILFAGHELRVLVDTNLRRILEKKFSLPVKLYNDADAFAVAEHILSDAKPSELTLGVIWGSGVGYGLVQGTKNKLVFPVGSHVELGHQPLGSLTVEQTAGGIPVQQRYFHMTGKHISIKQIYARQKKDSLAKHLIEHMLDAMIVSLTTATLSFAPDYVVLGGGVSQLPVLKKLRSGIAKKLPKGISAPPLRRFTLGPDAGLIGAALLVQQKK